MDPHVVGAGERLQVLNSVVERVMVDVVHDHPGRDRAIRCFPDDDSTLAPHTGLSDLDPCSLPPIPPTLTNGHRADGIAAIAVVARLECSRLVSRSIPVRPIAAVHRAELPVALAVGERLEALGANMLDHPASLAAFYGTGTTGAVADLHGRDAIGIDLDPANTELHQARYDEVKKSLFGVDPPLEGQLDLLA